MVTAAGPSAAPLVRGRELGHVVARMLRRSADKHEAAGRQPLARRSDFVLGWGALCSARFRLRRACAHADRF